MSLIDDLTWRTWLIRCDQHDLWDLTLIKEYDPRFDHHIETHFELTIYDPALYTEFALKWL